MIRLADYVIRTIADTGVGHIFMLVGGGAMHLDDAIGKEERIRYLCNQHEQASAMAAEGYARLTGKMAVVCVTSGPGGTNAITGLLGQWQDSISALYLSGQVRYDLTVASTGLPLRQFGDQEVDIVKMVKPVTKYAIMITDPQTIRYHLERAMYLAVSGRPGPVWLDIPLDVQSAMIDEAILPGYDPAEDAPANISSLSGDQVDGVIEKLVNSERPVILAGSGIRLAHAAEDFYQLAEKLGIPVQVAWNAIDLFPTDHPLYAGRPGAMGQRGANFVFQNADLLLSIGSRLNIRQIGYNFASTSRQAYKISVDIDPAELKKRSVTIDLPVCADAGEFIRLMGDRLSARKLPSRSVWLAWCKERLQRYPIMLPEFRQHDAPVNPYVFSEELSRQLGASDVIVTSNGTTRFITGTVLQIKYGQRHIVNSGCSAMGHGLPAAIGACFANEGRRVICLEGDGSIQLNIQELVTVQHHHLPLKIFVFSNGGYLSIRTMQKGFFKGHMIGESDKSGVGFPDFVRVAEAYGIRAFRITNHHQLEKTIQRVLEIEGPVLCDIIMDPDCFVIPRVISRQLADGRMVSSPLEEMYPFLDEDEFLSNMIIPRWHAG